MKKLNITESKSPLGHNSYYVQISRLELGNVVDVKWNGRWHDVYIELVPGEYEIEAMQVGRVGDMEFCTGNFFKGQKHTTAKINDGMIWMKVFEFPSGTKNKKKWIYENVGNQVVDTLKFYIYEENGKHRFLPEDGKIEEGSVYIEPYVWGFTPITVKLDSRDISKKVNEGYRNVRKSFKESKMERKAMKKLNITKERFEKSNYFKRKYGKLEYVSESGKLFKTSKGKVLTFLEASKRMFNQKELVQMFADGESGIDKFIASPYFILVAENDSKDKLLCVQRNGLTIAIDLLERYKSGEHDIYEKTFIDIADAEPYIYQLCRRNKLHVIKKSIGGFFDDLMFESGNLYKTNKGKILKFKESAVEATDPALVCPYCGGTNCEISIGTDDLNLTYFDKLDGETFNVECWCNDCNKPYNVTLELKVKNVYPNEDADELQYGDWE